MIRMCPWDIGTMGTMFKEDKGMEVKRVRTLLRVSSRQQLHEDDVFMSFVTVVKRCEFAFVA